MDRILPIQVPTKYDTVVNLKTAKQLGLAVPQSLIARADEVLEHSNFCCAARVRIWHKADIQLLLGNVRFR